MTKIALINLKKWRTDPVIYLVFGLIVVFVIYLFGPIYPFAAEHDETISAWIVSAYFTPAHMTILYVALLGLMFSNAPFYDASAQFSVVRVGRLRWILGQVVYVFAASFLMVAAIWLATWLRYLPRLSFADDWGRVVKSMILNGQLSSEYPMRVYLPNIANTFEPIKTAVLSFVMMWLGTTFGGMLLMFTSFFFGKVVSFSVFGFFWFMSMVPKWMAQMGWGKYALYACPFNYLNIYYTFEYNGMEGLPPFAYCVSMLAVTIVIFATATVIGFCRRDLDAGKEE